MDDAIETDDGIFLPSNSQSSTSTAPTNINSENDHDNDGFSFLNDHSDESKKKTSREQENNDDKDMNLFSERKSPVLETLEEVSTNPFESDGTKDSESEYKSTSSSALGSNSTSSSTSSTSAVSVANSNVAQPVSSANTTSSSSSSSQQHSSSSTTSTNTTKRVIAENNIRNSESYTAFRKNVLLSRFPIKNTFWSFYEVDTSASSSSTSSTSSVESSLQDTPIICLPGTTGAADAFFYQLLSIGSKGYRILSVTYPPLFTAQAFCDEFLLFLDALHIKKTQKVHLLGVSLGGYLALQFATRHPNRVESIMLMNSFIDTSEYQKSSYFLKMLPYSPEFVLKKLVLDSFPQQSFYPDAIDFMVDSFETLKRDDIAARLTLNSVHENVNTNKLSEIPITIMDPQDDVTMPMSMRQRLYDALPNAKHAFIKHGGDFPFLSVPDEINMLIQVHLRGLGHFPSPPSSQKPSHSNPDTTTITPAAATVTVDTPANQPTSSTPNVSDIKTPIESAATASSSSSSSSFQSPSVNRRPPPPSTTSQFITFKPSTKQDAAKFYEGSLEEDTQEKNKQSTNLSMSAVASAPRSHAIHSSTATSNSSDANLNTKTNTNDIDQLQHQQQQKQLLHQQQRQLVKDEITAEIFQDKLRQQTQSAKLAALFDDDDALSSSKTTKGGIFD